MFLFSRTFFTLAALCVCSLSPRGLAQPGKSMLAGESDLVPWEPEELRHETRQEVAPLNPAHLPALASLMLIRWYQNDIAPNSISRCPFYPSCSAFAEEAILEHGFLLGLCLFIDRNLYRENAQMYQFYDLIEASPGVLKLDDRHFLNRHRNE